MKKPTFFVMILLIYILHFGLIAQNVSYNLNSIPITGANSVALGFESLLSNNGDDNVAVGHRALFLNDLGSNNVAVGYQSLYSNTFGNYNTANGYQSMYLNIDGYANDAHGFQTLFNNISGKENVGFGLQTLSQNQFGNDNSALGFRALYNNIDGNNNTAMGDSAGFKSIGNKNLFIGNGAGYKEITGNNKLYISNDSSNTIIYGNFSTRQILLGDSNPTDYLFKGIRTLNVIGGIITDSIRVALSTAWSDEVFADNYSLKSIDELEKYIQTYKHLPNMPSSDEVTKNGIDVADMDAKLLEKIEELHLYILLQQKQIESQQKQLDALKKHRPKKI